MVLEQKYQQFTFMFLLLFIVIFVLCRLAMVTPVFQCYMLLFLVVSGVHLLVGYQP